MKNVQIFLPVYKYFKEKVAPLPCFYARIILTSALYSRIAQKIWNGKIILYRWTPLGLFHL